MNRRYDVTKTLFAGLMVILCLGSVPGHAEDRAEDIALKQRIEFVKDRCAELVNKGEMELRRAQPDYMTALDLFARAENMMSPLVRQPRTWAIEWMHSHHKKMGTTHLSYAKNLLKAVTNATVTADNYEGLTNKLKESNEHFRNARACDETHKKTVDAQLKAIVSIEAELHREWINVVDNKEIIARREIQVKVTRLIAEGEALRNADPPDYPEAIAKFTQAERLLKVGHVGAARASERE